MAIGLVMLPKMRLDGPTPGVPSMVTLTPMVEAIMTCRQKSLLAETGGELLVSLRKLLVDSFLGGNFWVPCWLAVVSPFQGGAFTPVFVNCGVVASLVYR